MVRVVRVGATLPCSTAYRPSAPAVAPTELPTVRLRVVARLADASNDVGLTGVVFLRDIEMHEPDADTDSETDTVTVRVKTNRPLSTPETEIVRSKLLDR